MSTRDRPSGGSPRAPERGAEETDTPDTGTAEGAMPAALLAVDEDTREWLDQIDAWEGAVGARGPFTGDEITRSNKSASPGPGARASGRTGLGAHVSLQLGAEESGALVMPTLEELARGRRPSSPPTGAASRAPLVAAPVGDAVSHEDPTVTARLPGAVPEAPAPEAVLLSVAHRLTLDFEGPLAAETPALFALDGGGRLPDLDASLEALLAELATQPRPGGTVRSSSGDLALRLRESLTLLHAEFEVSERRGDAARRCALMRFEAATTSRVLGEEEAAATLCADALRLSAAMGTDPAHVQRLRLRLVRNAEARAIADAADAARRIANHAGIDASAYAALACELGELTGLVATKGATGVAFHDPLELCDEAVALVPRGRLDRVAALIARAGDEAGGKLGASLLATAALCEMMNGGFDRALDCARRAQALDPTNPRAAVCEILDGVFRVSEHERFEGVPQSGEGAPRPRRLPPARDEALALASRLTDVELRAAYLRTLARAAERAGDDETAAIFIEAAAGGRSLGELPLGDRLMLLPARLASSTKSEETLEELLAGRLEPAQRALLASAAAESFMALGRADLAVLAVHKGLEACPEATFVALVAEELAEVEGAHRAAALKLWGAGDPARRQNVQYALALLALDEGDRAGFARFAKAALGPAFGERGALETSEGFGAGLFIDLAWAALRRRDVSNARALLEDGARVLSLAGEEMLAAALRERGEDARHAEHPAAAVGRALALSVSSPAWVTEPLDHPRMLASLLLEGARQPEAIAMRFRAAALSARSVTQRVLEAAVWLSVAGKPKQSLQLLQSRWQAPLSHSLAAFLRRLLAQLSIVVDPEAAAAIFERLAKDESEPTLRAALEFRRAEALFACGRVVDGAAALRALAGGPLVLEVDSVYRRLLWMAGDGAALDALARDEAEAQRGIGRIPEAAAAILDRAVVRAALLDDPAGALDLVREARVLQPEAPAPRVAELFLSGRAGHRERVLTWLGAACGEEGEPLSMDAALVALWMTDGGAPALSESMQALVAKTLRRDSEEPRLAVVERILAERVESEHALALLERARGFDAHTAAALWCEVGEQHVQAERMIPARLAFMTACRIDPDNVAARLGCARSELSLGDYPIACASLLELGARLADPGWRGRAFALAGHLAATQLGDSESAERHYRDALRADPANKLAFSGLEAILDARGDAASLAEILNTRAAAIRDPAEIGTLVLRRVAALLSIGQREEAKSALRALLIEQPSHAMALSRLGDMEFDDGAFAIAAELYLRLVKLEPPADLQKRALRNLGRIYHRRLNDMKLAIGAYERVLRLDPEDVEALSALSTLYGKQNDLSRAIAITEKAIALEADPNRRLTLLVQLGNLHEKAGDPKAAEVLLRRAVADGPRSLQAIGELARFYERNHDPQSRRVLLDSSLALLREDLRRDPAALETLRTIVPLLRWRKRAAGSAAIAQLLGALTPDERERREVSKWARAAERGRRLSPLANPEIDRMILPSGRLVGLRHVLSLCGPALARLRKPDLRRFGLSHARRIPAGRAPRTVFEPLAVDLNQRGFDLYVCGDPPTVLAAEPGDPPAIILGEAWVTAGTAALRFAAGATLRLVASHFDLLLAGQPHDGAALLAAIIREFIPGHALTDLDPSLVARMQSRVGKALNRALRSEMSPFVAEIAALVEPSALRNYVVESAARVGLLASGDLGESLRVLLGSGLGNLQADQGVTPAPIGTVPFDAQGLRSNPVAVSLIDFSLSSEFEMLVRALDSVS